MVVFLAGPYSSDTDDGIEENIENAIYYGALLIAKGHTPIVPHLAHYIDKYVEALYDVGFNYERWMTYTLSLVPRCDALFYFAPSPGADREKALAETLGIPVYTRLDDFPDVNE